MRSIVRWCLAATVLLCVLFPSASWADDPALAKPKDAKAQEHLVEGNRLYGVRQFEDAAKSYVAGALIEPAPIFDYNLGQCYRQLARYEDAIWHYKRFLDRGQPGPELRRYVEGFIEQMNAELAKKATTQPPTEPAGTTTTTSTASTTPPAAGLTGKRKVAIVAWAVGAIGVGAGVYFETSARNKYDDAKAETMNQERRDELYDSANGRRHTAIVVGAVGAATVVTGALLWVTGKPERDSVALAPRIERDGAAIVLSGHF